MPYLSQPAVSGELQENHQYVEEEPMSLKPRTSWRAYVKVRPVKRVTSKYHECQNPDLCKVRITVDVVALSQRVRGNKR